MVGINIDRLFGNTSGDFMHLSNSCASISACAAKARLLALKIKTSQ